MVCQNSVSRFALTAAVAAVVLALAGGHSHAAPITSASGAYVTGPESGSVYTLPAQVASVTANGGGPSPYSAALSSLSVNLASYSTNPGTVSLTAGGPGGTFTITGAGGTATFAIEGTYTLTNIPGAVQFGIITQNNPLGGLELISSTDVQHDWGPVGQFWNFSISANVAQGATPFFTPDSPGTVNVAQNSSASFSLSPTGNFVGGTTVPEPSTFALLALGGGALAGWRRWRKRQAAA
jgi:hypothetical protein